MNDRDLIRLAITNLPALELDVWLTKHVTGKGRRTGSLALSITEDAWRYRLRNAEDRLTKLIAAQEETAA